MAEVAFGSPAYADALACRDACLRRPLGMVLSALDVAGEDRQRHFAALEVGAVRATLSAKPLGPDRAKLRQMAVAPAYRGSGLGRALVGFAEAALARDGITAVELAARLSAAGFYRRLGYEAFGETFEEVSLPHVGMRKLLIPPGGAIR